VNRHHPAILLLAVTATVAAATSVLSFLYHRPRSQAAMVAVTALAAAAGTLLARYASHDLPWEAASLSRRPRCR
jgi:hypothetical protein